MTIDSAVVAAVGTLLLAFAGVGGGFLISKSELLQDRQARWTRAADLLDAARHDELETWEDAWALNPDPNVNNVPWGLVDGDFGILSKLELHSERPWRERVSLWWRWAWNAMLRCNVCSGWHVIEALLVGAVLWAAADPDLSGWAALAAAPLLWLAAGAVHTVVSSAANQKEIW